MLDILANGFKQAKDHLKGVSTLTEDNLKGALAAVRQSLLDADVEYGVAKSFLQRVQDGALGRSVQVRAGAGDNRMKVRPGDHFVDICRQEMERLMGPVDTSLNLPANNTATVMMVGLQGSGKTTTTGKIARHLQKSGRKPLLVAADIYRPAAIEQLKVLGQRLSVPVFSLPGAKPQEICKAALAAAPAQGADVVIFDTAGRLTIDEALMTELAEIKALVRPDNILLVCDAMMGQDSVTTAKSFDQRLGIDGVVITKLDGDARGGAALSIKEVTGKPIKFLGMGEDLDRLEEFRPEGLASRILGMGDIVGLMQDFERVSEGDREAEAMKMLKGQFNFRDFYEQLSNIQKMGSLKDVFAKLPMQNMLPKDVNLDDGELIKVKAMIDSMTEQERIDPNCFNDSRMKRVARGSGRSAKEVSELIKRFKQMRQMMGMLGQGMGLLGKIPGGKALGQLNQLRNMAKQAGMGGGGGFPGLPGFGGGMPDFGAMGGLFGGGAAEPKAPRNVDRDKLRKMRKAAKNARKKNRR